MDGKMKALLASYARSVAGAALTLYMAGVTDPKTLAYSLAGALAPVAMRYLNPNDKSFGRMPKEEEVAEVLKDIQVKKPVKKVVKKAVKKKSGGGGKPQQAL